jgi:uncharacterized protein YecE (DUF72 family)
VEINNTFYRMPTEGMLTSWMQQVPDDFIFAFKAPQLITHRKRLQGVGNDTRYLFRTLSLLHNKQGPVLFQFPNSFSADPRALEYFLTLLPDQALCAFEFRHPSWINDVILNLLRDKACSLCTADTDENPAADIVSTASWGYLRLRRSNYTDADLSIWIKRINLEKWKTVYVFFKHEEEAKGPQLAMRLQNLAEKLSGVPTRAVPHPS